jgi:aminoglycoside 6'-N-acetyltransferase
MMFTWRAVTAEDFPLLARWLATPHVMPWWNHETSAAAVERDFGPSARGEEPNEDLVAHLGGAPVGLLQRSFIHDYPEDIEDLRLLVDVPERAMQIDYLIGDPANVGRGIGTALVRSALEHLWVEHPAAQCVIVAVHADNVPSWRALEKAGMRRIAEGELEPDNPEHDRRHVVYRIDR